MPTFTVPGKPIGKPRHKVPRFGKPYIPKDHAYWAYVETIQLFCRMKHPFEGPVIVNITAYLPRPKKYDKQLPPGACPHVWKPDKDNIEKSVLDALSGHCYVDDQRVFDGRTTKLCVPRGTEPKTIITIEPGGSV